MNHDAWDIFMSINPDSRGSSGSRCFLGELYDLLYIATHSSQLGFTTSVILGPLRLLKCLIYLLLFALVLACSAVSKLSIVTMTSNVRDNGKVLVSYYAKCAY